MTITDTYITDAAYEVLLQAILNPVPSLDPRSQLIETLGELGNIWPASIHPDAVDQIAETPADKRAAKTYRDMLDTNAKAMAKLETLKPRITR
jgi:hypothetical protein